MKEIIFSFCLIIIFNFIGCSQSNEKKAFKLYNDGLSLSLDASKMRDGNNEEKVREQYLQAIEKYKKVLKLDSLHKIAASSIAYNYYEIRNFDEAIIWFQKAIQRDSSFAVNYQFLGLSLINKGRVSDGKKNIDKAFELDKSEKMKSITIGNLVDIGTLAYSYGESYEIEESKSKGKDYKIFSVKVLILALGYSKNDIKISQLIKDFTGRLNDADFSKWVNEQIK